MKKHIWTATGAALGLLCLSNPATSATITTGGFSFSPNQYAIGATNVVGATSNVASLTDGDLFTGINFQLGGVIRLDFGLDIVNGPGPDILGLEVGSPHTFSISLSEEALEGVIVGSNAITVFLPNQSRQHYTFDLSELGIPDGANIGRTVYLRNGVVSTPDIVEVAALNVVPLPAGLPLLLGALGALGLVKRRSHAHVAAGGPAMVG